MKPPAQGVRRIIADAQAAPIETPIFSKCYALLRWLIPCTLNFPRQQRFVCAQALQSQGQELLRLLLQAQRSPSSASLCAKLMHADVSLAQMRMNWRLAHEWLLVSDGTFEHGVRLMDEMGRLLGAWLKNARAALRAAKLLRAEAALAVLKQAHSGEPPPIAD